MRSRSALLLAVAAFSSVLTTMPAMAQPAPTDGIAAPTVMVLFDSSGSMWGNLPGSRAPKFELAREALRGALPAPSATNTKSGLIVFGRSCSNATLAVSPAVQTADNLLAPIERLNPRSKGPITLSLARAAQALSPDTPASLILVHDGPDNCRADPCAQAREIAQSHPNLTAHLVSLGVDDADLAATSCIAETLRGKVFRANSASEVTASVSDAINLAMLAAPAPANEPAAETSPAAQIPEPEFDPDGPPHLVLSATLGKDGPAVAEAVRWQVFNATGDPGRPILDITEPRFAAPIATGNYRVQAAYGQAVATAEITVSDKGATRRTLIFDAGIVSIGTLASSSMSNAETVVTVHRSGENEPAAAPVAVLPASSDQIVLPAGSYQVTTQRGGAREITAIEVQTGTEQALVPLTRFGVLRVDVGTGASASGAPPSSPPDDVIITVSVDDPDQPSGQRQVRRAASQSATFMLPAGTYYVRAASGASTGLTQIALSPGTQARAEVFLPIATLRLSAKIARAEASSPDLDVVYRVSKLPGAGGQEVAWSGKREPLFHLPPGKYQITAEMGARNVRAIKPVELAAGDDRSVTLEAAAARISLGLSGANSLRFADRFWEVRTASGEIVWRTNTFAPTAILAPGRYVIRCETRAGLLEGAFTINSGEDREILLNAG